MIIKQMKENLMTYIYLENILQKIKYRKISVTDARCEMRDLTYNDPLYIYPI